MAANQPGGTSSRSACARVARTAGTLGGVQGSELDACPVDSPGHNTAQRIDLSGQVPLADTADGGVAAHLPERGAIFCVTNSVRAPARAAAMQASVPA